MSTSGILMRLVSPSQGDSGLEKRYPDSPCPNIQRIYHLKANDEQEPSFNSIYFLSDISPIVESDLAYKEDVKCFASIGEVSWIVCAFINGRDSSDPKARAADLLATAPAQGSVVVAVGQTPREDKEQDYHDWYDQEHGEKLTRVPGWNSARRYRLVKNYGVADTANFYGLNFYEEENGLGGPEWKSGITEWTMRIRSNAAKPNIRRVWKVLDTKET